MTTPDLLREARERYERCLEFHDVEDFRRLACDYFPALLDLAEAGERLQAQLKEYEDGEEWQAARIAELEAALKAELADCLCDDGKVRTWISNGEHVDYCPACKPLRDALKGATKCER